MGRQSEWKGDLSDELTVDRCRVCATPLLDGETRFCSSRCEFDDKTMFDASEEPLEDVR